MIGWGPYLLTAGARAIDVVPPEEASGTIVLLQLDINAQVTVSPTTGSPVALPVAGAVPVQYQLAFAPCKRIRIQLTSVAGTATVSGAHL